MTSLYVFVEGQTEEAFVKKLLRPIYKNRGLELIPLLIWSSPGQAGGVHRYAKMKPQIERQCKQDAEAHVTTLFDLYGLPGSFPGKNSTSYPSSGSGRRKALFLEHAWADDIGRSNFIPNLLVHEFEALLFSDIGAFELWADKEKSLKPLRAISKSTAPEDINDGPQTAPSKRILAALPNYRKAFHGPLIAGEIGLDAIRAKCPHFDGWLRKIDSLVRK